MKRISILQHNLMRAAMTLALMVTCATAWADNDPVSYIDANGTTQTCTNYTVLHTGDIVSNLPGGWYVVSEDAEFSSQMKFSGTAHIILCDGKTLTINVHNSGNAIPCNAIWCSSDSGNLFFYGQSGQTGTLTATATNTEAIYASGASPNGNITINGGIINASGNAGLYALHGNVIINGGRVIANGIKSWSGNIILGWTRTTDYIHASSYSTNGTVSVATFQAFLINGDPDWQVSGTITDLSLINDRGLMPDVSRGFTASSDGNTCTIWNDAGWDVFCNYINNGESFSGKTVKLIADITITRMAGSNDKPFNGTFDGQGHTLTLNYGTASNPIDAQFVAPFVMTYWNISPTFRNLTIDGYIYSTCTDTSITEKNTGGLIGHLYGDVTIENCTSNVEITCPGGAGGFVGLCEHTVNFTDCLSGAIIHSAGGNNSGFVGWSRDSGYEINFTGCVFNGKLLQINGDSNGGSNGGFIGWKGDSKIVTITDCLYAPAALAEGETMADYNSATFARGWNENATAPNSYYITPFGTPQGKQTHSITAGQYVIFVDNAGTATVYATSGITSFGTGIQYNNVLYAGEGDNVSLMLNHSYPPSSIFVAYTASGGTLTGEENPYTLTMPNADVTITATMAWVQTVNYLNADGTIGSHEAIAINSSYMPTTLGTENTETWYVVTESVFYHYTPSIILWGDVKLILGDGCTMTVEAGSYLNAIDGYQGDDNIGGAGSLTIYGQELNTGMLDVIKANNNAIEVASGYTQHSGNVITEGYDSYCGIFSNSHIVIDGGQVTANGSSGIKGAGITISGGQVIANSTSEIEYPLIFGGLVSSSGDITISGGQVTAHGNNGHGIYCIEDGNITLGWTNVSDYIYASNYKVANDQAVRIAQDQVLFTDDVPSVAVYGTVSDLNQINGKTLTPADYHTHFSQTGDHQYTIYTAEGWNYFCDFISLGKDFSNDTVKLGTSIEVTRMAGSDDKPFKGVFKGHNHVLTVNYSGSEDYIAPFRAIQGNVEFWNLKVRGTINSTGDYAAGLVGHLRGAVYINGCTSNVDITCAGGAGGFLGLCEDGIYIVDCLSSAVIHSAGGNNGGFIGYSYSNDFDISFRGCIFNGKLLQHNGNGGENGGFLGWKGDNQHVQIRDCLYNPAPLSAGETYASDGSATFSREHADYAATITNSYYTTAFGIPQGKQARTITAGEYVTIDIEYVVDYTHCNLLALMSGNGIKYNNVVYSSNGKQVDHLCLSNTPPTGCTFNSYTVSPEGASLTYNSGYYYMLMPDADVTINATFGYTLAITGYGDSDGGWAFIASPVSGSIKPDEVQNLIANPATDFDLYRFNQSADLEWENWKKEGDHYHFQIEPGKGYLYANSNNVTLTFVGTPYSGDGRVTLTKNNNAALSGWNLVGNPFNLNTYIDRPFYIMNEQGSDIIAAADVDRNYIKPMEGIFVEAASDNETMTFSTTAPIGNPSPTLVVNVNQTVTNRGGTTTAVIDRAIVRFDEGQTLPKFQIRENSTKIYIPQGAEDYAIAYSDGQGEMPVNFKAKENGTYTITVNPEGVELGYLHLIDNMTGTDIDLLQTPSYTFNAKTTDYESRFKLVFSAIGDENGDNEDAPFAYYANDEIRLLVETCHGASLQVVDVMGRVLVCRDARCASAISTVGMTPGVYMIRLINGDNVKVQKIVVR